MMRVAVRELKAGLSRLLARAQRGEVIEVTSHGKPVARIVGIPREADPGLRKALACGALSWSGGKPRLAPPLTLQADAKPVSQLVLEDRG